MAEPHNNIKTQDMPNPAANVIRAKIDTLYAEEPAAKQELAEIKNDSHLSKHQLYMYELGRSGKSLAEIQTAWHNYYQNLSDKEKHEVWEEFYAEHGKHKKPSHIRSEPPHSNTSSKEYDVDTRPSSVAHVKNRVLKHASGRAKISKAGHFKSLLFGVGMGFITLVIVLFGFFNERFVAPFITPSKAVSSTPIIIDPNSSVVGKESKIIIPKINVEIPVVYDVNTVSEAAIQKGLERGVVHYSSTPDPGQFGNSVIVGHSSNNLLNPGKYKFAFVLLKQLNEGDTFMLTKGGKRYVYRVFDKKIVKPSDVSVLGSTSKPATVTLITCDPPGTSINRLVVVGEQISPNPAKNKKSSAKTATDTQIVPGSAPTLWSRFWNWLAN